MKKVRAIILIIVFQTAVTTSHPGFQVQPATLNSTGTSDKFEHHMSHFIYDFDLLNLDTPSQDISINMQVIPEASKAHCRYCFDVLIAKLSNKELPPFPQGLADPKVPIFVTWLNNKQLRGCIGTFAPGHLSSILGKFALISSLEDNRFKTITLDEVKELNVGVSLLYNFQPRKNPMDWEIGKHGIIVSASFEGQDYSATYLPEVPVLNSWSKEQALRRAIKKSGFKGNLEDLPAISLVTYQTSKAKLEFSEYEQMIN